MTTSTPLEPTSDEKVMGALAYFFGMLGALLVWLLQREKSRFVRFHALQALGFDLIVMVFMFVVMFCSFGVMFLGMFGTMFAGLNSSPSEAAPLLMVSTMGMPFLLFLCVFPIALVLTVIRLYAAVTVLLGRDFRYPWLGQRIESFLGDEA